MRLPWLQLDADGITRGEMLGRLLGIGPHAGVGVALAVWRWGLEMAPDGDFSGGPHDALALSAGVGIDDPRLVDELSRCGLLVVVADAGLVPVSFKTVRIRGLDRYKRAWEKNQRRKPAPVVPVTGKNPAPSAPVPARKTETETETEKELQKKAPRTKRADAPPDGWRAKTDALCADYEAAVREKYLWGGERDTTALKRLLSAATLEEVRARWRRGLELGDKWPGVRTVGQLALRWNDLGKTLAPSRDARDTPEVYSDGYVKLVAP